MKEEKKQAHIRNIARRLARAAGNNIGKDWEAYIPQAYEVVDKEEGFKAKEESHEDRDSAGVVIPRKNERLGATNKRSVGYHTVRARQMKSSISSVLAKNTVGSRTPSGMSTRWKNLHSNIVSSAKLKTKVIYNPKTGAIWQKRGKTIFVNACAGGQVKHIDPREYIKMKLREARKQQ
jgi:hypothetical protein